MSAAGMPKGGKGRIVVVGNGMVLCTSEHEVTIGGRLGVDVVVEDPVIAARHCRITHDGDGTFQLRDLGSVTGTWLDGRRAAAFSEITDGSEIVVGATKLVAKIERSAAITTLTLDLQRCGFWWKKPGKGVFDNDPDAMVRSEVAFGRFPLLHLTNRIAAVAAGVLLVAAILFGSVFQPLVDAGPLVPAHAAVRDLGPTATDVHAHVAKCAQIADEQGCNACHEPGNGTPMQKCMQCHGDLQEPATWRHPFLGDGKLGPLPGIAADEAFCTVCHRDHEGSDFLKAKSRELVGNCAACHHTGEGPFDDAALRAKAPPVATATRDRAHSTIAFPHDRHADSGMRCDLCHRRDPQRTASAVDDPDRDDFGEVPFATCAACHVPGAPISEGMTAAEQTTFREKTKDHQWPVRWHGTDDGGKGCASCHTAAERAGERVFGPAMATVERPLATADQYAAERATYVAGRRMHDSEFQAHAGGKQCLECHVRGDLVATTAPRAAVFWHALHLTASSLSPLPGNGGAVSTDDRTGCISCHHDRKTANALRAASSGAFSWPKDEAAQAACRTCHSDGDKANALQATPQPVAADRRHTVAAFPHDVHTSSTQFGAPGTALADGCFACHEFTAPTGGTALQMVPRVKPKAADCTQCHSGHDNVAGGSCQQCHPDLDGTANSFTLAARAADAVAPQRRWPAANGFSHTSPGHSGTDLDGKPITCAVCHDDQATKAAKTIATVPVPDESQAVCRQCHLQRQFHWR